MKISVVIVNYNVKYFLEQCLISCINALKGIEGEIIVADNNSVDGSAELLKEKFPGVVLIENKQNLGFSKANNQAINIAKGEYILLLNPDTVVQEDTFKKCIEFMDSTPDAGGLGVKMIDGKGNFLPESKRGLPTPSVAFYKIFGLSFLFPKSIKFGQYHLTYLNKDEIHKVDVLSGAFMFLRKSVLEKTGLLDETFFMYGEDIDLSYRIKLAGYNNYYFPHTTIIHYKGESTKKSSINYVFVFYRAMIVFAQKHFSGNRQMMFSLLINMAVYFRAFIAIVNRLIKKTVLPASDFLLQLTGLYIIKHYYQLKTGIQYADELIKTAFPLYSLIWVLGIFFAGGYDKPYRLKNIVKGIILGTAFILIAYSLLHESYRFSRAIILLGTIWIAFFSLLLRLLLNALPFSQYKLGDRQNKRFIIAGEKTEIEKVKALMHKSGIKPELVLPVFPSSHFTRTENPDYVTSLSQLQDAIDVFNINEVIFCNKNISSETIIGIIAGNRNSNVQYKIAQPESLYLIGSSSILAEGMLSYSNAINSIANASQKRIKRITDMALAIAFLIFLPVILWFVKNKMQFIKNIFHVMAGNKTWVGYMNRESAITSLPLLPEGVLTPAEIQNGNATQKEILAEKINYLYASIYKPENDLKIIFSNISSLGN